MGCSDPGLLGIEAVEAALALSTEAGWNQTAQDWRVFLAHGRVFGVRDAGRLVATAAALPYDGFGFVAMVLTTSLCRGRGLATRLLRDAVEALVAAGRVPVLDATPAGRPVYARHGFSELFGLHRWARDIAPRAALTASPAGRRDTVVALDAAAFGAARAFLVDDIHARPGAHLYATETSALLTRAGRRTTHCGPLIANSEAGAIVLLDQAVAETSAAMSIDVPDRWPDLAAYLGRAGFTRQRPFTRMALGRREPYGDPARLFAIAGPEFG